MEPALAFCKTRLRSADGVSNDKIIFGKVAALNGPAQALGQDIRKGILAAFEGANRAGGVNGRKLGLKSIDDSYEPEKPSSPPIMRAAEEIAQSIERIVARVANSATIASQATSEAKAITDAVRGLRRRLTKSVRSATPSAA